MGMNNDHLKQLPITQVLEDLGLMGQMKQRQNGQWFGPCPIHSGDNPHAFVITPSKNLWYCFTQCHAGGDVIDLVRRLNNSSYYQALQYLSVFKSIQTPDLEIEQHSAIDKVAYKPFTRVLSVDQNNSVLGQKGIKSETARLFQAGVYSRKGYLNNCIVVRLHNTRGNPLGYAGRRLDPHEAAERGKWKFPPQFPKRNILFNYHRTKHHCNKAIVVVECPWGAMRLHQLNIPVVSLLGTHLSDMQFRILSMIPQVVLMLDGDPAGRKAAFVINQRFQSYTRSNIVALPDGQDPDDLCDLDLQHLVQPFFPHL